MGVESENTSSQEDMTPTAKRQKRVKSRSKYTRPCDGCSLRKIKCDLQTPCSRCANHNIPCTYHRTRKKCGPKNLQDKTRLSIAALTDVGFSNTVSFAPAILINQLLPCLQIYQTWYYGVWPVVSVAHLISCLVNQNPMTNTESISSYSLACAIAAAICLQVSFLSPDSPMSKVPLDLKSFDYVQESIRARDKIDYRLNATPDSLLTSFFLSLYYINSKGGLQGAITYLRESISIAQIMGLHSAHTYKTKTAAETHRLKKIYYLLLVTERFMCIEDNVPIILESAIPFPSLDDEEYPSLLAGFTELVKVFAIPDKQFFEKVGKLKFMNDVDGTSKQWIIDIQLQLSKIKVVDTLPETQKLNIILSKYWMKSIAWHITQTNHLISQSPPCVTYQFPIVIAHDFLQEVRTLSLFAFESNGPGVCIKLLELATGIVDSLALSKYQHADEVGFNYLSSIFSLISRMKNDITLPIDLYEKIESIIKTRTFNQKPGYISELDESSSERSQERPPSPFTQMTMTFGMPVNNLNQDPIVDLAPFRCEPEFANLFNGLDAEIFSLLSEASVRHDSL